MAALKPHYTLCPLLGAHNLVGIGADREENTLLVTLGPNVIVKHKLSDQKPLKSWSTRQSNQITCSVVYDCISEKYVGVLNKKHICMWGEDESNLESAKKHTFSTPIHKVHAVGKLSIIVFENGYSESLDISLHRRKEEKPSLLNTGETLLKSFLETVKEQTILVLSTSNDKFYYVRLAPDGTPEGNLSFSLQNKNNLRNLGSAVVNDGDAISVVTFWSDGELTQSSEQGDVVARYKLSGICPSSPVAMVMLDATHIAVYGADVSEEGAVLVLFDLKFGVNVAIRRLKFFCDPPHLYCLPANNVLMLCVVQNLVVVPYLLQSSLLWNLIDNTQLPETRGKPELLTWSENESVVVARSCPLNFRRGETTKLAQSLWASNASNCQLFDELLPVLKEDGDTIGICLLLSHVKDLPEKWLADLLNFALECGEEGGFLDVLLSLPYSDVCLLNHMRKKLTTKSTITLLENLSRCLETVQWTRDCQAPDSRPDINQVIDWISLVLDAHHHELLIASSDLKIKQLIEHLGRLVTESYEFLDCLGHSESLIGLLEQKRKPPENRRKDWYAVEVVRLL